MALDAYERRQQQELERQQRQQEEQPWQQQQQPLPQLGAAFAEDALQAPMESYGDGDYSFGGTLDAAGDGWQDGQGWSQDQDEAYGDEYVDEGLGGQEGSPFDDDQR